jgi:predicted secreted protein
VRRTIRAERLIMPKHSLPRGTALLLAGLLMAAGPAWGETLLRLSETATVTEHPDELDASLRVEVTATNAAEAQRRVNATMGDALAAAKSVAAVTASTGAYFVWRVAPTATDRAEHWQANQSIDLTSHDGAAMLKLVGELQQKGLAIGQLGWRLSDAATRAARAEATRKAIAALRGRAEEAAGLLALRFDSFKEVRLDSTRPPPMPRLMAMAAPMASASAPPPSAEPTDVSVSATAEADVVLLPK